MRSRTVGLLAVVALLIASCGGGSVEGSGVSDGIGVHGAWTIDIINPDGSLDQHIEFENALLEEGVQALVELLARAQTTGPWMISLENASGTPPCPSFLGCEIVEPSWNGASDSTDLTVEAFAGSVFRMTGSVVATQDGEVRSVSTWNDSCVSSIAPADCSGGTVDIFTSKALDPADFVSVVTGQTVQVQVDISFEALP